MNTAVQACAKALFYAQQHVSTNPGQCDHYCGVWYGLSHSGYLTAHDHFLSVPSSYRHGTGLAPAGALHFWANGGAGHVAIGLGNGLVASTDFPVTGKVGVVAINDITVGWNQTYNGWTDAYFGAQGVVVVYTPPLPPPIVKKGNHMAVMYLHSSGHAVLIESGKQIRLEPAHANRYSLDNLPYANVVDALTEARYLKAYGPVVD